MNQKISASDIRWMSVALNQAEKAPHAKWRVGAVLVRGGSVISTGYNRYRNNPSQVELPDVSYHAEEVALKRAGDSAEGSTLYVARLTRSGDLALSRPCEWCQHKLSEYGVYTVSWTTEYGLIKTRLKHLLA